MNDDITATLAPKSDQLDAIDLMGKPPRVFTITGVDVRSGDEQPVSVHLAEFPRVWRPNVSMRRVLGYCWTTKSSVWVGRQVELYCDDKVRFGPDTTGGTRISRLSDIDGPKSVPLLLSKGKSGVWKVDPLTTEARVASLRAEWKSAEPQRRAAIEAEVAALTKGDLAEPVRHADEVPVAEGGETPRPAEEHDPTLADDWQGGAA